MKDIQFANGKAIVKGKLGVFMHSLATESDRGVVIIVATVIEEILRKTMREFLIQESESDRLLRRNFQGLDSLSRASLCLGLISRRELKAIDAIRKIRNEFAHQFLSNKFDGTLQSHRHQVFAATQEYLPGRHAGPRDTARHTFDELPMALVFQLWSRAEEVANSETFAEL